MKKKTINTFIVLVFCLDIILLVFLKGSNDVLDLVLRLLTFPGLAWILYLYYQSLDSSNFLADFEMMPSKRHLEVDKNPDSQFLNLINSSFLFINDLNINFDAAIYFLQPKGEGFSIKNSMSDKFVETISTQSSVINNIEKLKK